MDCPRIFTLLPLLVALASCTTRIIEETQKHEQKPKPEKASWTLGQMPSLNSREDIDNIVLQLRSGPELERRKLFVAIQLAMDYCLPHLLEHLEDMHDFEGMTFPIVNRSGTKLSSVTIPAKGFNTGAAIERFLIGYFYKEPARTSFNIRKREGASELWKKWYSARAERFRWNSWGVYSTK